MKFILTLLAGAFSLSAIAQETKAPPPPKSDTAKRTIVPGMYIKPATISYNLVNGQTGVAKINIANHLSERKQMKLYLGDWTRDTIGGHMFFEPGKFPQSCMRWVTLDKDFVELDPGQNVDVIIRMKIPDSAEAIKEMKWTMLFVESLEEAKTPKASDKGLETVVTKNMRFGVHLYQTPPSIKNGEVKMLSFTPVSDKKYKIVYQNVGEIQLECKTTIEFAAQATGEKINLPQHIFPTFPGQTKYEEFTLPATMAKGKYTATALVDAGDDVPLEAAQLQIEVK